MDEILALQNKRLLRVDEAARLLNISRWTVYRWVEAGQLGGTRIGAGSLRIFSDTVAALINHHCVGASVEGRTVQEGDVLKKIVRAERPPKLSLRHRGSAATSGLMMKAAIQRSFRLMIGVFAFAYSMGAFDPQAEASCGSVSCFVVIGSQQAVSPAGVLTVNFNYTYTPNVIPSGGVNTIPFANSQLKQLILANSKVSQLETLVKTAALDLNYGLTERIGLEVLIPYKFVDAVGQIGAGAVSHNSDRGIGDVLAKVKYNMLPTLRSMLVLEMGVYFPSGDYGNHATTTQLVESTLQVGRGAFGLQPGFYQTYEILPHRLNQFLSGNYRYTVRNSDGYRFGQEFTINAGLNLVTFPWLTFTGQINFRHKDKDNLEAGLYEFRPAPFNRAVLLDGNIIGRPVPTTDHTLVAFSPGVLINAFDFGQLYVIAQIPIYRDFNGNLEQGISYLGGMTKTFATPPLF